MSAIEIGPAKLRDVLHTSQGWDRLRALGKISKITYISNAVALLAGCYESPIDAVEAIPIIGDFFAVTGILRWADAWQSDIEHCYEKLEDAFIETTRTGGSLAKWAKANGCQGYWWRDPSSLLPLR